MSQTEILEAIDASGPMSVRQIAREIRGHPSTIGHQLDALRRSGDVDYVLRERRGPAGTRTYYLWGRPESLLMIGDI